MYKLGRLPRTRLPGIPHLSSWMSSMVLPEPPASISYVTSMPPDYGAMLNDVLGDCTCAAYYHAMQVWSFNAGGVEITASDADVLRLYEVTCGYDPGDPSTDVGGVEQNVLEYIHQHGLPQAPAGMIWSHMQPEAHKLLAYFEVDHRNPKDIKRVISECGVAYIGFNVPDNVMPVHGQPPKQWTFQAGSSLEGGHAVVLVGYDEEWITFISWGELYQMTWDFFTTYTDECYALCDSTWINATGRTPFGMTMVDLKAQMSALSAVSRLRALKIELNQPN